ncbi:MAG: PTS sugar transporter subunit IIB [Clostridium sp.]|uniref:PTS sugar transporter subunit IIB n=1 Tax=Clostridium sp. TaxID=1506 RepID=UPI0029060DF0|nr:PTS sugar transporter subunit IIB [Clostridium sp.]MDU5108915.1 PTS sugar transporter subunit IIB [Clostridium sp.]
MKKILLVCAAGMSTSLLVNKMKEAAVKRGIEIEIDALPVSECSSVIDSVDIVLLGPQVRFQKPQVDALVSGRIPVEVIDMRQYGRMDGESILESALAKIS